MTIRRNLLLISLVCFAVILAVCASSFVFAFDAQTADFGANISYMYKEVYFTSATSSSSSKLSATYNIRTLTITVNNLGSSGGRGGSSSSSSATLTCTIHNSFDYVAYYNGYTEQSNSNSKISYTVSGLTDGFSLSPNEDLTVKIKVSVSSSSSGRGGSSSKQSGTIVLYFDFKDSYEVKSGETVDEVIDKTIENGGQIKLTEDTEISALNIKATTTNDIAIDLNGYNLTCTNSQDGGHAIEATGSTNITIRNSQPATGEFICNEIAVYIDENYSGTFTLDGVSVKTTGDVAVRNASTSNGKLYVKNSTIYSEQWAGINNVASGILEIDGSTISGNNYGVKNNGGGTATVKNSTITQRGDNAVSLSYTEMAGVYNANNSTLNIENCTVTGVYHAMMVESGTVNIYSGIYTNTDTTDEGNDTLILVDGGTLNINNGTFTSASIDNKALYANGGSTNVNGGTLVGTLANTSGSIVVKGGTYQSETYSNYLADGYSSSSTDSRGYYIVSYNN
jgi:hypothetical protein